MADPVHEFAANPRAGYRTQAKKAEDPAYFFKTKAAVFGKVKRQERDHHSSCPVDKGDQGQKPYLPPQVLK